MRSMASTILNEHGWDPELIEVALAHVDMDEVRSAYNRAEPKPSLVLAEKAPQNLGPAQVEVLVVTNPQTHNW